MTFGPDQSRARRRPGLTPMIDVVFLLLVFFMLAARFGVEGVRPLVLPTTGAASWEGPPRLVSVTPDALALNGVPVAEERLAEALRELMPGPDAPVLLRPEDGTDVQRVIDAIEALEAVGITALLIGGG